MIDSGIVKFRNFNNSYLFPATLILIPFSFPYPKFGVTNILIGLLAVLWIVKGSIRSRLQLFLKNRLALLFIATYFIYIVSLVYSDDVKSGWFLLEKKSLLLIFPIILSTEFIDRELIQKILFSFVLTCLLASGFCIVNVVLQDLFLNDPLKAITFDSFERERFCSFLNIHPPYFSYYVTFATIIVVFFSFKYWNSLSFFKKCAGVGIFTFFIFINIVLSSRMPLIVLALMMTVLFIRFLLRRPLIGTLLLISTVSIIAYMAHKDSLISDRFEEIIDTKWNPPIGEYHNSTNVRIGILTCSFELLREHWLLGLGAGSVQHELNACYQAHGYSDVMHKEKLNAHNEYLNVWLNTGIVGLLVFMASLFIPFREACQVKNFMYLAFLSLIILACFTECLIERQKGVILYAFFNSLFAFNLKEKF